MITMVLGGLWHGADMDLRRLGALHGLASRSCRIWLHMRGRSDREIGYSLVGNIATFLFVTLAWIFFRSPDFAVATQVLGRFFVLSPTHLVAWPAALVFLAAMLAVHVVFYRIELERMVARIEPLPFAFAYGGAVAMILPFVNVNVQPFIYFQF